ncbi:MAG: hypothetical protein IT365_27945 [Candidatus Hydrogenedentes bacterium]|nr:hypothetical protein [Candidatus Hydrogenedentota bacterium]
MALTLTAYLTAETLIGGMDVPEVRARAVERLRAGKISRVVLEGFRAGSVASESLLREARDYFAAEGFTVLGGIMPLQGAGFGKRSEGVETRQAVFCYSDEDTVAALELEVRKLARLFGQIVIDDAFFTSCRCAVCAAACHDGDWGAMRRRQLGMVAERWLDAAHAENPRVRVTVKFPQYYDRYGRFGYDVERFPAIFDAVWQGTETRDPTTLDFGYVEPYQGYFNLRWMQLCAGGKCESGWFDFLDCDGQQFFDQAVTTSLGGAPDIVIWCYDERLFNGSRMGRLAKSLDSLRALNDAAVDPKGVYVVKPPNRDGGRDLYVYDYLGMLGIPCVPAHSMTPSMQSVILTAHAVSDPSVAEAIPRALMAGRHVIVTFDALHKLKRKPQILEFFGYRPQDVIHAGGVVREFIIEDAAYPCEKPFRVHGDLAPTDTSVLAWAVLDASEDAPIRIPMVTSKVYAGGGRAIVWNVGTFGHEDFDIREQLNVPVKSDWFNLPKRVVDFLRRTATAPHGYTIKAPARVASFLFAGHAAFVNYGITPVEVEVAGLKWDPASLQSDSPKTACSGNTLYLATRSYALLKTR